MRGEVASGTIICADPGMPASAFQERALRFPAEVTPWGSRRWEVAEPLACASRGRHEGPPELPSRTGWPSAGVQGARAVVAQTQAEAGLALADGTMMTEAGHRGKALKLHAVHLWAICCEAGEELRPESCRGVLHTYREHTGS